MNNSSGEQRRIGPAGGIGGHPFESYTIPEGATLSEIHILHDEFINAIQFVYRDSAGKSHVLPPLGGRSGSHTVLYLEPGEYMTGISGRAGWYIDSLRVETNRRSLGLLGGAGGDLPYRFECPAGCSVVGLFGRAGDYIDALGLITKPLQTESQSDDGTGIQVKTSSDHEDGAAPAANGEQMQTEPRPKELQRIDGVGPKIASLLVAQGIVDLDALARADVDELRSILLKAGKRFRLADPTTWPSQANSQRRRNRGQG